MADTGLKISPLFYVFKTGKDFESFLAHNESLGPIHLFDTIIDQLFELIRTRNPKEKFFSSEKEEKVKEHFGDIDLKSYGVWVFYPWSRNLVHVLPEEEFIELRTNRNQFKITPKEQQYLSRKRVGIIGLSVGQSVALTMAMERSAGEFHLADFDSLDLSNLNRIRSKIYQLGLSKTLLCAQEMLEIDPFLNIYIYENGIDENNIDYFLNSVNKLDLLIEECDGLDIKILARYKAREFGIPVLMETSDRGLLDIERFDLEPNRAIMHGLIGDLNPATLKGLSQEDKIEYLLPMVGLSSISERMKASMLEVQSSIVSWPQLASAVTMGGGVAAEMG
ncbi:MAG: ThiF family adenylyltransferase, partial [Bacteroidia bacterium]|nr:ThiF family adenylyltransferase [Bacteroidia bacterium]